VVKASKLSLKARGIAFYLPQFHPIPENDSRWGEGFTEWTNVRRATRLFAEHYQPRIPTELGYYDLRSSETRAAQAELARAHGIEAFCYWHYWSAGRRLLERPFNAVLEEREPDFPFCLAWANHSWTAAWVGRPWEMIVEQRYQGREDYEQHFDSLRNAFADDRYLTVDGKPLFIVFRPDKLFEPRMFTDCWRERALRAGFKGLHLLGIVNETDVATNLGFDGGIPKGGELMTLLPTSTKRKDEWRRRSRVLLERPQLAFVHQALARSTRPRLPAKLQDVHDELSSRLLLPLTSSYADTVVRALQQSELPPKAYPSVLPNWDNTPRFGRWGTVLHGSSPELFARHVRHAVKSLADRPSEDRLLFVKSWNEWAEGNYMEPDERYGRGYLEAFRDEITAAVPQSDESSVRRQSA
jgi:lipopolysaccharide biosynthesis protein